MVTDFFPSLKHHDSVVCDTIMPYYLSLSLASLKLILRCKLHVVVFNIIGLSCIDHRCIPCDVFVRSKIDILYRDIENDV